MAALLAAPAAAQNVPPSVRQSAQQAAPARTAQGSELQGYVLMLQEAEEKLQQAKQRADQEPARTREGAMTPARQELMQQTREAWRTMERAPPSFADNPTYRRAEQRMREDFGAIGPSRTLSKEEGDRAAQDALRTLDELRSAAAQVAAQEGASVPAPPVAGGGR